MKKIIGKRGGNIAFTRLFLPLVFVLSAFSPFVSASSASTSNSSDSNSSAVEDTTSVQLLLTKMSQALRQQNYQGLFTYEYGGSLETLRIVHAVREGVEFERLEHLSGPEREVLRQGKRVDCLTPGDQLLQGRLQDVHKKFGSLSQYYHFYLRGDDRVAGREASVLQVVPKTEDRYGYTLAMDKQTGLPLKSLLVNQKMRVLERFQFVEIDLDSAISEQDLQPVSVAHQVASHKLSACNQEVLPQAKRWQVNWLPGGFMLSGQATGKDNSSRLMYTDGLSVFSVFIEPAKGKVIPEGRAQRGATVALMGGLMFEKIPYRVTVVGEIPTRTARLVAASIRGIASEPAPQ